MGLLVVGDPLTWKQTLLLRHYVKFHGIKQFIIAYTKHKNRKCDRFLWGDEVECILLHLHPETNKLQVQLRSHEILAELNEESLELEKKNQQPQSFEQPVSSSSSSSPIVPMVFTDNTTHRDLKQWNVTFHPEYGNFMLEVTPNVPYGGTIQDLLAVESNMRLRRAILQSKLKKHEFVLYATNFAFFGTPNFARLPYPQLQTSQFMLNTSPKKAPELERNDPNFIHQEQLSPCGPVLQSDYVPDEVMSPHPRFATLSGNIRRRRGKKVDIALPLFIDENTKVENFPDKHVHSDAMGFGMGSCCLQVTFQTHSNTEARYLYDQLAILSPLFLSLTSNTPFHRGHIVDTDVRWSTIQQAVDDRMDDEKADFSSENGEITDNGFKTGGLTPALSPLPDIPELQQENPYITYFRNRLIKQREDMMEKDSICEITAPTFPLHDADCDAKFTYHPIFDEQAVLSKYPLISDLKQTSSENTNDDNSTTSTLSSPLPLSLPTSNTSNTSMMNSLHNQKDKKCCFGKNSFIASTQMPCDEWAADGVGTPYNDLPFDPLDSSSIPSPFTSNSTIPPNQYPQLFKSRYSSIDCYINDAPQHHYHPTYNDVQFPYHLPSYLFLKDHQVDPLLSKHVASLFMRDPLVMFNGQIDQDDYTQVNHFESIQSSNWRSVRYKPPSHASQPGFRTEFRTCELQFTDFENAAFTCFITLLARSIVYFNLNFYLPLSKVDENFDFAHKRDSLLGQKYWFRHTSHTSLQDLQQCPRNIDTKLQCPDLILKLRLENEPNLSNDAVQTQTQSTDEVYFSLLSLAEIINGQPLHPSKPGFVGLIPIVTRYLQCIGCDHDSNIVIQSYLSLISQRATGKLLSGAQFQRLFMANHPLYTAKRDSMIPEVALNDLLMLIHGIQNLTIVIPELTGLLDKSIITTSTSEAVTNDITPATVISMNTILDTLQNHYNDNNTLLRQLIEENKQIIGSAPRCSLCQNNSDSTPAAVQPTCIGCNGTGLLTCPTNTATMHPMYNTRSNYQRLLTNSHMQRFPHTFSVDAGHQMLDQPTQLQGSTSCNPRHAAPSMTELHNYILPSPQLSPAQPGMNSIPFESIE